MWDGRHKLFVESEHFFCGNRRQLFDTFRSILILGKLEKLGIDDCRIGMINCWPAAELLRLSLWFYFSWKRGKFLHQSSYLSIQFTDFLCEPFSANISVLIQIVFDAFFIWKQLYGERGVFQQSTIESFFLQKTLSSEMRFFALAPSVRSIRWAMALTLGASSQVLIASGPTSMYKCGYSYFVHFAWMLFVCRTIDLWQAADRINKSPVNEWIEWEKASLFWIRDDQFSYHITFSQWVSESEWKGLHNLPLLLRLPLTGAFISLTCVHIANEMAYKIYALV